MAKTPRKKTDKRPPTAAPTKQKQTRSRKAGQAAKPRPATPEPPRAALDAFQAEARLNRIREQWTQIQEVRAERERVATELKDKINNNREAMLSVIREPAHDKPARELDRCREWLKAAERLEAQLADHNKRTKDRLKALDGELHGLIFDEQLTLALPGVGETTVGNGHGEPQQELLDRVLDPKELAEDLVQARAHVSFRAGKQSITGRVLGHPVGEKDGKTPRVWIKLDKPTKLAGRMREEVTITVDKLTRLGLLTTPDNKTIEDDPRPLPEPPAAA